MNVDYVFVFFFSSRRRHTILVSDWSSDVCSSDLLDSSVRTYAGFEFGREVKTKSEIVSSRAAKLVFHRPVPAILFEANGSPMNERLRETLVTCMLCDHDVCFEIALPSQDSRMGFVANQKRHGFVGLVLLDLVNLDRGVICGRAEPLAFTQIGRIDIRARVNNESRPARRDVDAERVVVTVRTAPVDSVAARVEKQIKIVVPHQVSSRVGKGLRRSRLTGQRCKITQAL